MRLTASALSAASFAMALVAACMGEPWAGVLFIGLGWFGAILRQWAGRIRQ